MKFRIERKILEFADVWRLQRSSNSRAASAISQRIHSGRKIFVGSTENERRFCCFFFSRKDSRQKRRIESFSRLSRVRRFQLRSEPRVRRFTESTNQDSADRSSKKKSFAENFRRKTFSSSVEAFLGAISDLRDIFRIPSKPADSSALPERAPWKIPIGFEKESSVGEQIEAFTIRWHFHCQTSKVQLSDKDSAFLELLTKRTSLVENFPKKKRSEIFSRKKIFLREFFFFFQRKIFRWPKFFSSFSRRIWTRRVLSFLNRPLGVCSKIFAEILPKSSAKKKKLFAFRFRRVFFFLQFDQKTNRADFYARKNSSLRGAFKRNGLAANGKFSAIEEKYSTTRFSSFVQSNSR